MSYTESYKQIQERLDSGAKEFRLSEETNSAKAGPMLRPFVQAMQVPSEMARLNIALCQKRASRYAELPHQLTACRGPDDAMRMYASFWTRMFEDYTSYWQQLNQSLLRTAQGNQAALADAARSGQDGIMGVSKTMQSMGWPMANLCGSSDKGPRS